MTKPRTNSPRATSPINANLNRQLMAYAAAASAAGVGLLAAPQVAEAKIVYTPTNVSTGVGGSIPIDLNNDGTPDFLVFGRSCGFRGNCLFIDPLVLGNGIRGINALASAGIYGLPAGPQAPFLSKFVTSSGQSFVGFMAVVSYYHSGWNSGGPWTDKTNKYLGFKFLINGKIHYGWARMTVIMRKNSIVLTGYAYETIPNHRILEGHTQGLSASDLPPTDLLTPAPQPASLGMLARGADDLAVWRREDEVAVHRDNAKQM